MGLDFAEKNKTMQCKGGETRKQAVVRRNFTIVSVLLHCTCWASL